MKSIQCKFSKDALVPQEAVVGIQNDDELRTMDGKICTARFISGWNNEDGSYDERLNELCMSLWNVPFSTIRSIWIERIGNVGCVWHWIQMSEK